MEKINKPDRLILVCGTAILALLLGIATISPSLRSGVFERDLVPVFTVLLVAAAAVYFLSVASLRKNLAASVPLIILFGFTFRVVFMFSTPVLENDFYRYMWDGGVLANGLNPYNHSPLDVSEGKANENLFKLKERHEESFENINHPHVKTIYPPVAQLFFATAYALSPMSVTAWRLVLLIFDAATLLLLLLTLRTLGMPLQNCLIYWWNPLLVKVIFNSVHMDVLAFPFVLGAVLLFLAGRKKLWVLALSLAAGVKFWPALIFGTMIKPITNRRETVLQALVFTLLVALMVLPMLPAGQDSAAGLVAYGKSWQNNSPLFAAILGGGEMLLESIGIHPGHAQKYSRIAIVVALALWKFYVIFLMRESIGIHRKALLIVGVGFLLSPTQFPWYYTWLLPFLAVAPSRAFLSLTALLPLYYLQYYFSSGEGGGIFENVVVWVEFAPAWILLALEASRFISTERKRKAEEEG